MTQKELLYFEDAINHEDTIIALCNNAIQNLEDESLVEFMEKEVEEHTKFKEKLIKHLEDKSNE